MEHTEILNLWKSYDQKLEQALSINKATAQDVLKLKTKSVLASMKPIKLFTLLVGCVWVMLGSVIITNLFMYAYDKVSHFFFYFSAIQLILTTIAIAIYLYQLVVIQQVDVSDSVLKTQKRLSYLKSSTLWCARILFLQLPVWTTFYLSESTFLSGNIAYITINGIITLIFTCISVWLFLNINYSNKDKKWFKIIFEGKEWNPIIESLGYYREIEDYTKE